MKIRHLLLVMVFPWVVSCHYEEGPFKIGINRWLGYESLFLAEQQGLYPVVDIVRLSSTLDVLRALRNGNLQGAALTLDEILTLTDQGIDLQIVAVIDYSNGADVVMAHPTVTAIAELRGKRIGVEVNAVGALLLHGVIDKAGVAISDVTIAPMSVTQMAHACTEKTIDAAIAYQPFASDLSACGMRTVFSSAEMPGQIVDVLVVRRDAMHHTQALRELIHGHYQTLAFIAENPVEAHARIANDLGMTAQSVQQELKGLHLLTREESLAMMQSSGELVRTIDTVQALMKSRGMIRENIEGADLIDTRWLEEESTP